MPTQAARKILPAHLEPMELRHGSGIFAATAFDFSDSEVGAYQEIVLAVIVPPLVQKGAAFPKSAFYPFLLGTSTPESREHAIERWHLPHYMQNVAVDFAEAPGKVEIRVRDGARPILDYVVTDHAWGPVNHLYQSFMHDGARRFKVDVHMEGRLSEHEEETGTLTLHDHPMCAKLPAEEVATTPFRELWMKDGVQTFEELETL